MDTGKEIEISKLRPVLAETVNEVRYSKRPVTILKRGTQVARIVPMDFPIPEGSDRVVSDPTAKLAGDPPGSLNPAEPG